MPAKFPQGVNCCDQCAETADWLLCSPKTHAQLCLACWVREAKPACHECGTELKGETAVLDLEAGVLLCWDKGCAA